MSKTSGSNDIGIGQSNLWQILNFFMSQTDQIQDKTQGIILKLNY